MKIETFTEMKSAVNALRDWFKSQDIDPPDAMIIVEYFQAMMIETNSKSTEDIEEKIKLIISTIRTFLAARASVR